jgi:hypothetical protein
MTVAEEIRARTEARELLRALWKRRTEIWGSAKNVADLVPIPVDVLVRSLLGLKLEEPEEIQPETSDIEIAGVMDRPAKLIVAAQKFPWEWRRFTIAHEIGHWVLHPDVRYHRDRPLCGGEQANRGRPKEEQEVDKFASELLMPERVLTQYFMEMFGKRIDGTAPSSALADELSSISGTRITRETLAIGRRRRSLLIATLPIGRCGKYFTPLAKRFLVSKTAMAIQLEDLRLVA